MPYEGRFINEDTLFGDMNIPLTQNLYLYVINNAMNMIDPSGHISEPLNRQKLIQYYTSEKDSKIKYINELNKNLNNQYVQGSARIGMENALSKEQKDLEKIVIQLDRLKYPGQTQKNIDNAKKNSVNKMCDPGTDKTNETYVSKEQLKQLGFTGVNEYIVTSLNNTLKKYEITEPKYIQHFLAQCRQEGNLALTEAGWLSAKAVKEYTMKYEPGVGRLAEQLGNTEEGDGYRFRGGGYIQITGRYNYQVYADSFKDPQIVQEIMSKGADYVAEYLAWDAAGYWWDNNNMNAEIDNGASATEVSRGVNRGKNNMYNTKKTPDHLDERLYYYEQAVKIIK